ncbi:MAG: Hpt domain-containing protein [Lentisphaeria bacterium]
MTTRNELFTYIKENLGIDDPEIISELLQEYCETFRGYQIKFLRCLAQTDSDGLYRAAHSLKGCSGNVGHEKVYQLCLSLESAAQTSNFTEVEEILRLLSSAATELCPED